MSQLVTTSEVRAVVGDLQRRQVMDLLRGATFIGILLVVWVSLRPFIDLGNAALKDVSTGNETPTYLAFGVFTVVTLALAMRDNSPGLLTLLSPGYMLFGGWIVLSVVLSLDPGTSIRRFALTVCVISVASTLMLLPKSQSELARWFSIAALALLAICYLGVLLAPDLSIHLATDTQEPQLAGDWRGSFGHKNVAAAMMAMLLFIGIYIARVGPRLAGIAVFVLAAFFLFQAEGKSSTALFFAVLLLTSLASAVQALWLRGVIVLTPLVLMNLFSVGTVINSGLAAVVRGIADRRHASPGGSTSGPSRSRRCRRGWRPVTASRRSGAAVRSRIFRRAWSGRSMRRTATTDISTPR